MVSNRRVLLPISTCNEAIPPRFDASLKKKPTVMNTPIYWKTSRLDIIWLVGKRWNMSIYLSWANSNISFYMTTFWSYAAHAKAFKLFISITWTIMKWTRTNKANHCIRSVGAISSLLTTFRNNKKKRKARVEAYTYARTDNFLHIILVRNNSLIRHCHRMRIWLTLNSNISRVVPIVKFPFKK